jgi:hypothetical protein
MATDPAATGPATTGVGPPRPAERGKGRPDPGLLRRLCNCGGRPRLPRERCRSVGVSNVPIHRPDLAIYSQVEELAAGHVPRWDSPDILTNNWGPFRLMEEARVTVRNLSTDTPAINALVHYSIAPFGIGTRSQLLQSRLISLSAASQVELVFPLDSVTLTGDPRVGVHIAIEHPHDPRQINNRGSQVHDGSYTSEVGRSHSISFPVLNDSGVARQILLSLMPTDVLASVSPLSHHFAPYEQITATLTMTVPSFLVGTPASPIARDVTVVGRLQGGELLGGLTKLLRIDN